MKESNENSLIIQDIHIQNKIYNIRGFQVMLDSDLAQLDINKYNQQYSNLEVKITKKFHDIFMILDKKSIQLKIK